MKCLEQYTNIENEEGWDTRAEKKYQNQYLGRTLVSDKTKSCYLSYLFHKPAIRSASAGISAATIFG